jgi:subtilisin-like proprotein convertase family protein
VGQTFTDSFTFSVNQKVPDANWNGIAMATNLSGVSGTLSDVSVRLNLTGGYNGDLYGYLVHDTGFAVLLNRVGLSFTNSFGYADAGFSGLTLNGTAPTDVHFYGGNGGAPLGGLFAPDGRTVNPATTPPAGFDAAARTATLASFNGLSPNGEWTLFLADLSSGQESTLVNWGLDLKMVPEPTTWVLLFLGFALAGLRKLRSR